MKNILVMMIVFLSSYAHSDDERDMGNLVPVKTYWCKFGELPKTMEHIGKVVDIKSPRSELYQEYEIWLKSTTIYIEGDHLVIKKSVPHKSGNPDLEGQKIIRTRCKD